MVVGMIRALHFNRDLDQVCIQTPDGIRNKTITYLQIEFLSPGKHISTEITHKNASQTLRYEIFRIS